MRQRGFAHVLVLIIILVIAVSGIGYYAYRNGQIKLSPQEGISLSPTQVELKTYISPAGTFSIGYPANWTNINSSAENQVIIYQSPKNIDLTTELRVHIYDSADKSLQNFILGGDMDDSQGSISSYFSGDYRSHFVLKETNEHPVYQTFEPQEWPAIGSENFRFIVDEGTDKIAFILFLNNYQSVEESESDPLLSQILSTFKFLDSEETQESTENLPQFTVDYEYHPDWATYTDSIGGFSLQYNNTNQEQDETEIVTYTQIVSQEPGKSLVTQGCVIPPKNADVPYDTTCLSKTRITVFNDYTGGSRRLWLKSHITGYSCSDVLYADVYIQGKRGLIASYDCDSFGTTDVVIPNGSKIYLIQWGSRVHDEETNKFRSDMLNQALSSFKIL